MAVRYLYRIRQSGSEVPATPQESLLAGRTWFGILLTCKQPGRIKFP